MQFLKGLTKRMKREARIARLGYFATYRRDKATGQETADVVEEQRLV